VWTLPFPRFLSERARRGGSLPLPPTGFDFHSIPFVPVAGVTGPEEVDLSLVSNDEGAGRRVESACRFARSVSRGLVVERMQVEGMVMT
jgi:hypothetical protein